MKKLTEPQRKRVPNAWGKDVDVVHTDYEIEKSDVGNIKEHYMGHNHQRYSIRHDDVGRTIRVDSSPGGCWYFVK